MPATLTTPPPIDRMAEAIVAAVDPAAIVLFGSHATGRAGAGSDVDFLVIEAAPFTDAQRRLKLMDQVWRALDPFRVPKDILVFSQEEVERWGNTTNHIVARALREGQVVYERP